MLQQAIRDRENAYVASIHHEGTSLAPCAPEAQPHSKIVVLLRDPAVPVVDHRMNDSPRVEDVVTFRGDRTVACV